MKKSDVAFLIFSSKIIETSVVVSEQKENFQFPTGQEVGKEKKVVKANGFKWEAKLICL